MKVSQCSRVIIIYFLNTISQYYFSNVTLVFASHITPRIYRTANVLYNENMTLDSPQLRTFLLIGKLLIGISPFYNWLSVNVSSSPGLTFYGCWNVAKRIFMGYQNIFLFNHNEFPFNKIYLWYQNISLFSQYKFVLKKKSFII